MISWVKTATSKETHDCDALKIINGIRTSEKLRPKIEQIRAEKDKEARSALKRALPGVMWSGQFGERANDKLKQHSGLLCADIDSLNGDLPSTWDKLKASPYVWALFVSPSGEGLKVVYRVRADVTQHKASFRAVEKEVGERTNKHIDQACKDPARLCFL